MKKKLGIIQTGGLGDIHIALPIAKYYEKKNYEINWPIFEMWVAQMQHYVPWINWIGVERDEKDHAYNKPLLILNKLKMDKILPLYHFLGSKIDLSNTPFFPHVSFDEFKYLRAKVPFKLKWTLSECIKRDLDRENQAYNALIKKNDFVVTHLKASNHDADFDKTLVPKGYQIIEIPKEGYVLDYLKIIENAKMIFMTDSVMANIVDQLSIGSNKYFIPRSNIFNNPRFISKWTWIRNLNIDPKTNLTGIKFD